MKISTRILSRNDEASIFQAINNENHRLQPKPECIIYRRIPGTAHNHIDTNIICNLCGFAGHIAKDCTQVPSVNELEYMMMEDIHYAESQLEKTGAYQRDKFGLYKINAGEADPIPENESFAQNFYCVNCGLAGHLYPKCPHPSCSHIVNLMGSKLNPKTMANPTDLKESFSAIWNSS